MAVEEKAETDSKKKVRTANAAGSMETAMLPLTIRVWQDKSTKSRPYLAYSPDLQVVAGGKDAPAAKKNLLEIIRSIIEDEEKAGTLDEYLSEMGFSRDTASEQWEAPEFSFVQVPLKLKNA